MNSPDVIYGILRRAAKQKVRNRLWETGLESPEAGET